MRLMRLLPEDIDSLVCVSAPLKPRKTEPRPPVSFGGPADRVPPPPVLHRQLSANDYSDCVALFSEFSAGMLTEVRGLGTVLSTHKAFSVVTVQRDLPNVDSDTCDLVLYDQKVSHQVSRHLSQVAFRTTTSAGRTIFHVRGIEDRVHYVAFPSPDIVVVSNALELAKSILKRGDRESEAPAIASSVDASATVSGARHFKEDGRTVRLRFALRKSGVEFTLNRELRRRFAMEVQAHGENWWASVRALPASRGEVRCQLDFSRFSPLDASGVAMWVMSGFAFNPEFPYGSN